METQLICDIMGIYLSHYFQLGEDREPVKILKVPKEVILKILKKNSLYSSMTIEKLNDTLNFLWSRGIFAKCSDKNEEWFSLEKRTLFNKDDLGLYENY